MINHRCGNTFDYLLSLDDVGPTEFVGWSLLCQMRDNFGQLIDTIDASWVDPAAPTAIYLFKLETSNWKPGFASLNIRFTGPDGYDRSLLEPIKFNLERDSFK